jgi:hypothetical protein
MADTEESWEDIDEPDLAAGQGLLAGEPDINARKILSDIMGGLEGKPLPPGFARIVVDEINPSGEGSKTTRSRMIVMLMQALLKYGDAAPLPEADLPALERELERLKSEWKDEMADEIRRSIA